MEMLHRSVRQELGDFLIFSGWTLIMAKKIKHRGHGLRSKAVGRAQRVAIFSAHLCSLWFSDPIPEDNKKSQN